MIGAVVKTKNFDRTRKALDRIRKRLDRPGGFLGYAGAKGHKEIMRHFADEEGEKGRSWKALSPATEAGRRAGPRPSMGNKILQDTGRLRGSIVWMKAGKAAVKYLALVKYAVFHDKGIGKLPKRAFMFFPTKLLQGLAGKFAKHVLKK